MFAFVSSTPEQSNLSQDIPSNSTNQISLLHCESYNKDLVELSLAPSLFILVLLSFVERRKKIHDCERRFLCLAGRFSFIVPLDFTGKMQNRWSYALAFGALTPHVIDQIIDDTKDDELLPYLKVFVQLKSALLVSIACMPLFSCLSTPHRLLGGVLGLLYSLSWFAAQMWFVVACRTIKPKGNDFLDYMMRIGLLLDIPQIFCLGFLLCRFGSIILRGIQNRLSDYSKQEEVKKHEYKYVQCLLRRAAGVSVQKNWFQRNVYEWDPYFKFPNRIIATIVLSVYGLYLTVTGEQIVSWWVTVNVYKLQEMFKPFLNETSFSKHLNYFTYSWYISSACAALTCVIHISEVLVCYRKHIKSLRVGEKKFLPKTYKLDPAHGVIGLLKYPAYQVAFTIWGYVILHSVMFILGLMFMYLVISPIVEDGFLDWLKGFAITIEHVFILLVLMGLQRMLGHVFFLQDKTLPTDEGKPLALNNRKAFHNFNYFFFFINMVLGFMSCLWRVIQSASVGLMLLSCINRTIMPVGFEKLDKSYCTWLGMIMVDHYHTNPVLVCFCHLLLKHTSDGLQDSEYFRLNPEPLAKDRVRTRWLVVYTLLRNPKLILLRKKHKQNKHKEAERAFTWAVSNMG
ncbi:stimulated by retinoic acid gene 6 protein-like isoform 2-T2 [Clarias gariepinus]|uniref:stimulated by retinoic acid gene 6 protein-like isoform X2 n=1 Tax=Clarias gariepinus TaxID=13013 RepID=UPI00234E175C|nr:stimulated by retinoic acid gene 6 protein-like isoform X2 [Clarias gariepinus]